jgi:hypothetical protein
MGLLSENVMFNTSILGFVFGRPLGWATVDVGRNTKIEERISIIDRVFKVR